MSWYLDALSGASADIYKAGAGQTVAAHTGPKGEQFPGNEALTSLLGQFASNAGISSPFSTNQPLGTVNAGPVTVGGVPNGQGQGNQPANPYQQSQQQNQAQQQQGPYALNQAQSQALNQSIDRINKQAQVDLSTVTQELTAKGLTGAPLVAAQQQLREHYNQMASETQTKFYETVQQQKQQEIAALLKAMQGLQEQGLSGLGNVGQIHEQTARQDSAAFGNIINDLFSGAGSIAGLLTGVPGGGQPSAPFDYGAELSRYGVSDSELFTPPSSSDRTLAGEGEF